MNLITKLVVSLLVGAAAWAAYQQLPALPLAVAFCIATAATTLVTALLPGASGEDGASVPQAGGSEREHTAAEHASGSRETGEVKWFNMSKGFGFIIKDNGDEIFVHFRSIRGEGRRGLRDGQRVSFVEAQSSKGPQAEDVEPL
jgi:CspA family cold shock protein